jgi:hypothetical protein
MVKACPSLLDEQTLDGLLLTSSCMTALHYTCLRQTVPLLPEYYKFFLLATKFENYFLEFWRSLLRNC